VRNEKPGNKEKEKAAGRGKQGRKKNSGTQLDIGTAKGLDNRVLEDGYDAGKEKLEHDRGWARQWARRRIERVGELRHRSETCSLKLKRGEGPRNILRAVRGLKEEGRVVRHSTDQVRNCTEKRRGKKRLKGRKPEKSREDFCYGKIEGVKMTWGMHADKTPPL